TYVITVRVMNRRDLLLLPVAAAAAGISARAEGKYEGATGTVIRVEVFSDYQCPGCKQLHESTLRSLRDEFVNAGKVQIVHREFPLPMHQYARQAACLACAAEKMGHYRKVSDALFRDQPIWSTNG